MMENYRLSNLADSLIKEIKAKTDCFQTTTVVFPNSLTQQWFKSYWFKTQNDNVLMNVEFKTLSDILPYVVEQQNYSLIRQSALKQLVMSILQDDETNIIPEKLKKYYSNSEIKLNDLSSMLAKTLLDYYRDDFEDIDGWKDDYQYSLYKRVVELCSKNYFGTIEKPIAKKESNKTIYLFGFTHLDRVYRRLFDECGFVKEFNLEIDDKCDTAYTISAAPSKVREIETVHSDICKLLMNQDVSVSDFLVVAPNIADYVNTIERVFKQNDTEYPAISYVIRSREKRDTDVTLALRLMLDICRTQNFTRYDFYKLISNPIIQENRDIKDEEIDNWMRTIVKLHVYRKHLTLDDWKYLKTRLLLSKVSSINFDENVVSLKDSDYLPYTNIAFDDESILKLVTVINDIEALIDLFNNTESVNSENIELFKNEFDKWFADKNKPNEIRKEYKKILYSINVIKEINKKGLSRDLFFYSIIDDSLINSSQRGVAFAQGITFCDLDINTIVSAKYVYFIGASSANIPQPYVKNEIDLRTKHESFDETAFMMLYQNALEKMNISFVSTDLKSGEEFYLSPIVKALNKKKSKYLDEKYNKISLDQTNDYKELFTRKEFSDKKYYNGLFKNSEVEEEVKVEEGPHIFYESLNVYDLSSYLEEPLKSKLSRLFNKEDKLQEDIGDEFEPFNLDRLLSSKLKYKTAVDIFKKVLDKEKLRNEFELGNLLPTISEEIEEYNFENLLEKSEEIVNDIENLSSNNCVLVEPTSIKLVNKGIEWTLSSSKDMFLTDNGDTRIYYDVKDEDGTSSVSKFLNLYIMSLMDVAQLENNDQYHIILSKGGIEPQGHSFDNKTAADYDIKPSEAIEVLNKIHDAIGDYNHNVVAPLDLGNDKIKSFEDFTEKIAGEHGKWEFFDHKKMVAFEQYGYDIDNFELKNFYDELDRQVEMIKYLDKFEDKKAEGEENGEQN